MAIRDLIRKVQVAQSLSPAARVNGTSVGTAVDLRGFDAAMFVVSFGTYTDGTHAPSVQHSMDGTTYNSCGASDLDGTFSALSGTAGNNTVQSVGYIGSQRFVRVVMTVSGATTGALGAANVVAGYPRNAPVA
ncbi:MAG: hypothetical protein PHX43_08785 [Alphaproteobacteria bacterium]|nr:hypothetical protein [Alphaproteobacteria bacterium]